MAPPLQRASFNVWNLPDALLFNILTFVAAPTHRVGFLCHTMALLCKESHQAIIQQENRPLWDAVLKEDYGAVVEHNKDKRSSKRLRRTGIHRARDAHLLIKDNTELAFFYLYEMTNGKSAKHTLTCAKLRGLLSEYGPHLRVNWTVSSGGLYLVEVCRARNIRESVILKCVQELVENNGAQIDLRTNESLNSRQTALSVAAARGMFTVVRYLVEKGNANLEVRSSGRFRLHTQPKRTVRCTDATPLEFAKAMRDAEKEAGAREQDLSDLDKCIRLLAGSST